MSESTSQPTTYYDDMCEELADVVISAATCASQLGIDLDEAVEQKFAIVMSRGFGEASK